jgi:hypothetical protein
MNIVIVIIIIIIIIIIILLISLLNTNGVEGHGSEVEIPLLILEFPSLIYGFEVVSLNESC